jgi:hypothetical protein
MIMFIELVERVKLTSPYKDRIYSVVSRPYIMDVIREQLNDYTSKRLASPECEVAIFAEAFLPNSGKIYKFLIENGRAQVVDTTFVLGFGDSGYRIDNYRDPSPRLRPLVEEIEKKVATL